MVSMSGPGSLGWLVAAVFLGVLGASALTYQSLRQELSPLEDRGFFLSLILAPEGASMEYTDRNVHQVEVDGAFGNLRFEIRNVPSDTNPKTGRIVAMSVISALRQPKLALSIG